MTEILALVGKTRAFAIFILGFQYLTKRSKAVRNLRIPQFELHYGDNEVLQAHRRFNG